MHFVVVLTARGNSGLAKPNMLRRSQWESYTSYYRRSELWLPTVAVNGNVRVRLNRTFRGQNSTRSKLV